MEIQVAEQDVHHSLRILVHVVFGNEEAYSLCTAENIADPRQRKTTKICLKFENSNKHKDVFPHRIDVSEILVNCLINLLGQE